MATPSSSSVHAPTTPPVPLILSQNRSEKYTCSHHGCGKNFKFKEDLKMHTFRSKHLCISQGCAFAKLGCEKRFYDSPTRQKHEIKCPWSVQSWYETPFYEVSDQSYQPTHPTNYSPKPDMLF